MNTSLIESSGNRRQNGSTVLVLITLLIIMTMLALANSKALFHLRREIKWLEHEQVKRLNTSQTNTITTIEEPLKLEPK